MELLKSISIFCFYIKSNNGKNKIEKYRKINAILTHQIEYGLYGRSTNEEKIHNFPKILISIQSELAVQTLKDPYIFDFLTLSKNYKEKDLEEQLIKHITQFLLELGAGFAFIGRQYHLEIAGNVSFIYQEHPLMVRGGYYQSINNESETFLYFIFNGSKNDISGFSPTLVM